MSQSPNPFSQDAYAPYQGPSTQSPSPQGGYASPPKKSTWIYWVLGILGCLGVCMLLCCGSFFGLFWLGKNVLETAVITSLNADPVVTQQIGEVESASWNISQTKENGMVFDVKGSKANAQAFVRQDRFSNELKSMEVVLPSGERRAVAIVEP